MKKILKIMGLAIVGLLTAVIVYPFLHEVGHSLIALLVGAKIVDFNLLPLSFVVCNVSAVDRAGQMLIGLGGIVLPFVFSMSLQPKRFWTWYVSLLLKGISVYSIILSIIAMVFHMYGNSWQNDDIVQVLCIFPDGTWLFFIVLCVMVTYGLIRLLKENMFTKCMYYFDNSKKMI